MSISFVCIHCQKLFPYDKNIENYLEARQRAQDELNNHEKSCSLKGNKSIEDVEIAKQQALSDLKYHQKECGVEGKKKIAIYHSPNSGGNEHAPIDNSLTDDGVYLFDNEGEVYQQTQEIKRKKQELKSQITGLTSEKNSSLENLNATLQSLQDLQGQNQQLLTDKQQLFNAQEELQTKLEKLELVEKDYNLLLLKKREKELLDDGIKLHSLLEHEKEQRQLTSEQKKAKSLQAKCRKLRQQITTLQTDRDQQVQANELLIKNFTELANNNKKLLATYRQDKATHEDIQLQLTNDLNDVEQALDELRARQSDNSLTEPINTSQRSRKKFDYQDVSSFFSLEDGYQSAEDSPISFAPFSSDEESESSAELNDLRNQKQQLTREVQQAEMLKNNTLQSLRDLQEENRKLQDDLATTELQRENMEKAYDLATERLNIALNNLANKEEEITTLNQNYQNSQKENQQLAQFLANEQIQHQQTQFNLARQTSTKNQLIQQRDNICQSLYDLQAENQQFQWNIDDRIAERDSIAKERDDLAKQASGETRKVNLLQNKAASLRTQLRNAQDDLTARQAANLQAQLTIKERNIELLRNKAQYLRNDKRQLEQNLTTAQGTITTLNQQITTLTNEKNTLQTELTT
ncbi:5987_t:CDS:2 [Scutellospora calospora]|uniref:5987_t:CDS:1 n=1 Tax=Scutellospora calospora TaxID=85575 RepID=A0ACA9JV48_9GLOM|nr:5987_t:CDS:2 [Scutellospora calospora]